jgi:hypothetical protein
VSPVIAYPFIADLGSNVIISFVFWFISALIKRLNIAMATHLIPYAIGQDPYQQNASQIVSSVGTLAL